MLSKTIETLKYLLLEYRFYLFSIALLFTLLSYSYNKTLSLEKELLQINKELHLKQVIFEKRQMANDEKMKQQHAKIERMIKEIVLHK